MKSAIDANRLKTDFELVLPILENAATVDKTRRIAPEEYRARAARLHAALSAQIGRAHV